MFTDIGRVKCAFLYYMPALSKNHCIIRSYAFDFNISD